MGIMLMVFGLILIIKGLIPNEKLHFKNSIEKSELLLKK
jgi:hypothetical protein